MSTAVAGVTLLLFSAAVYARTRRRGSPPRRVVAYYGDVVEFRGDLDALRMALEEAADHNMDQLVDQLHQVSHIVARKYRLLTAAMWALLAATMGCCLAVATQL